MTEPDTFPVHRFLRRAGAFALVAGLLVGLACLGFALPIDLIISVVSGWALFLWRVIPSLTINVGGVLTCLTAFSLLCWGLHRFCQRYRSSWPFRHTLAIVAILLLMFVAGITVVGTAHQLYWLAKSPEPLVERSMWEAIARTDSQFDLKQMALAVHNREDHEGVGVVLIQGKGGQWYHGWPILLLPYCEKTTLYSQSDKSKPWSHPVNAPVFRTKISLFLREYEEQLFDPNGYALLHYAANSHLLRRTKSVSLAEINQNDGTSQTIFFGEIPGRYKPWGHPYHWRDPALGINRNLNGFGNLQAQGANFSMADGSVRFISEKISPRVLKALATPNGNEQLSNEEW